MRAPLPHQVQVPGSRLRERERREERGLKEKGRRREERKEMSESRQDRAEPEAGVSKMKSIKTRMTSLFNEWGLRVPVMNGPMAGVAGGALAAAVAQGGGLGFIAAGHGDGILSLEVEIYRSLTSGMKPRPPLCIGFITYSSLPKLGALLERLRPDVVQFFAPATSKNAENIVQARKHGARIIIAQVGSLEEASAAASAGVDAIIAQGSEAGGHGLRPGIGTPTLPLAATICSWLQRKGYAKQIVIAAGGIVDGRGLAAALSLGCDGVSMGTRFYATHEALGRSDHKAAIVGATCDTAIRTRVFDTIQNSYSANPWPAPYDSMGVLHNDTSKVWDSDVLCLEGEIGRQGPAGPIVNEYRGRGGDVRTAAVLMGQGAADVRDIEGATDVVVRVEREATDAIERAAAMIHCVCQVPNPA